MQTNQKKVESNCLSSMLFYINNDSLMHELEVFRLKYESIHGSTDLTKRYTSTWPQQQQNWLMEHEPKKYFDGLPNFVKVFIREKLVDAAQDGRLDDMPECFQKLYVTRQMEINHRER